MVDIHLLVNGSRIPFLSIPLDDIQRLSVRPFKWLRFVLFAICGTSGSILSTPNGDPVDDHSTDLGDVIVYYFKPAGDFIFADLKGLNDRVTASTKKGRDPNFRAEITERYASCVVTQEPAVDCDAAHLVPRSKGDDYLRKVVQDRSPLYGNPLTVSGINTIENGVLLCRMLHSKFGRGAVAFVKTPNSVVGLDATDIQRAGPATRTDYTVTLQQLEKPGDYNPTAVETLEHEGTLRPYAAIIYGASFDAQFRNGGSLESPPPSFIILDYVYGMAAYKCWGTPGQGRKLMENYHLKHYQHAKEAGPSNPKPSQNFTKRFATMTKHLKKKQAEDEA